MTTVYWTPATNTANRIDGHAYEANILFTEPIPAMKMIADTYVGYDFVRCPAITAFFKNTFVVTAPMDAVITVGIQNNSPYAHIDGHGWTQDFFDCFCEVRTDGSITIPPAYIFYAKESVEMEVLPVCLLDSPSVENTLLITGSFDIGKWVRSVDFTFIAKDKTKKVFIKRGDPLFFIRFKPKQEDKVVLERTRNDEQLTETFNSCTRFKNRVKNVPLPELYRLAKSHIDLFLKRKNNV